MKKQEFENIFKNTANNYTEDFQDFLYNYVDIDDIYDELYDNNELNINEVENYIYNELSDYINEYVDGYLMPVYTSDILEQAQRYNLLDIDIIEFDCACAGTINSIISCALFSYYTQQLYQELDEFARELEYNL
jgi:hypothetical protein